ncbi:MAG: DNA-3-methyladenine glycosylase I [Nitratireductor sp.]
MQDFEQIEELAFERHGEAAIRAFQKEATALTPKQLAKIPDDRWLAQATRSIFQSGFNWRVVDAKWDGFETAFEGFDLGRWIFSNDDDLSKLVSDTRIIRNGMKIKTVPENARFFGELANEAGSVGKFIGNWPLTDQVGLLDVLQKRGSRLGSMTGQYFLRFMGKDCYILSRDVTAALIRAGVVEKHPTTKKDKAATQNAFNEWSQQSGLGLSAVSTTLARSIDG